MTAARRVLAALALLALALALGQGGAGASSIRLSALRDGDNCTACAPGAYANVNTTQCSMCEPGFCFDAANCTLCEAGMFQVGANATACDDCEYGYSSGYGSTTCHECQPGSFSGQRGGICEPCGLGAWNIATAQSFCSECAQGTYKSWMGSGTCVDCGIGRYNQRFGAPSFLDCIECPPGSICPNQRNVVPQPCPPLFTSGSASAYCVPAATLVLLVVAVLAALAVSAGLVARHFVRKRRARRSMPTLMDVHAAEETMPIAAGLSSGSLPKARPHVYMGL